MLMGTSVTILTVNQSVFVCMAPLHQVPTKYFLKTLAAEPAEAPLGELSVCGCSDVNQ